MRKKIVWLAVSSLLVLALLATACGGEEAAPVIEKPAVEEEAAPAAEEEAPAEGAEMITVRLQKIDGTWIDKEIEKPRYGGRHIWATPSGPLGFDEALPGVPPYSYSIYWIGQTQEELLEGRWEKGPAGTNEIGWRGTGYWANPDVYRGALAESWEFPDPETIIFHIRKGVHWALDENSEASRLVGGREFTAEDAAYSIRRIYIESTTSTMYNMALDSRPTDVYAEDKYTLVVKHLPGQQGYTWEYVGDWMSTYPREVIEKYGNMNEWERVVGTGAFMLTDYVAGSQGTWKRNPNYWMRDPLIPENQLPYIDELKLLIIPDMSVQMSALRTGKIDRYSFSEEQARSVIETSPKELKYISYLRPGFGFLGFRLDKPELPFDDIRVRRALHMAINWEEIVDTYHRGNGEYLVYKVMPLKTNPDLWEAYTPLEELPPAPDGFDNKKLYTYNPEEAKELLAEAGYPNGFKTEAIIGYLTYLDYLEMFAAYWDKINVEFKIDVKEMGVYNSMHQQKTYKEGNLCGRWGDQPYAACSVRTGSMYNVAMTDDPEMDDYYNKMTAAYFDVPKRTEILREFNQNVISKVYYYVPPVGYEYSFWWPWVKGYHGEASTGVDNGVVPKYFWIDRDLKKSLGY